MSRQIVIEQTVTIQFMIRFETLAEWFERDGRNRFKPSFRRG